jgi:hypothetical protein
MVDEKVFLVNTYYFLLCMTAVKVENGCHQQREGENSCHVFTYGLN